MQQAALGLHLVLPSLRTLGLYELAPPSLRFLRHSPLLEELRLQSCAGMRLGGADDAMECLRGVAPRLRLRLLWRCVRLGEGREAALQPPSALELTPALQTFECRPPRGSLDQWPRSEDSATVHSPAAPRSICRCTQWSSIAHSAHPAPTNRQHYYSRGPDPVPRRIEL